MTTRTQTLHKLTGYLPTAGGTLTVVGPGLVMLTATSIPGNFSVTYFLKTDYLLWSCVKVSGEKEA
jgi:hypothetical protein